MAGRLNRVNFSWLEREMIIQSNFDRRGSLEQDEAFKREVCMCVLTHLTCRMCNV
jgi:hypothetical protein